MYTNYKEDKMSEKINETGVKNVDPELDPE